MTPRPRTAATPHMQPHTEATHAMIRARWCAADKSHHGGRGDRGRAMSRPRTACSEHMESNVRYSPDSRFQDTVYTKVQQNKWSTLAGQLPLLFFRLRYAFEQFRDIDIQRVRNAIQDLQRQIGVIGVTIAPNLAHPVHIDQSELTQSGLRNALALCDLSYF